MTPGAPGDTSPIRIAMWSGPRNLSTALMRSFGNRADCAVVDEPFYAAYLALSGAEHPMREEILQHHEMDWRKVAESLCGPAPDGKAVFYQKHMTHHMLPEIGRDWMRACKHAFLIRHPTRVLASYAAKREAVELNDIGFSQQADLFDEVVAFTGSLPPVVDAETLLADPPRVLAMLCSALGIPYSDAMLRWPPGRRAADGVWAEHWYEAVKRSTGFGPPHPAPSLSDPHLKRLAEHAQPLYDRLAAYAFA